MGALPISRGRLASFRPRALSLSAVAALAVTPVLAACGGGDAADSTASSSTSATTATVAKVATDYASATGNLRKAFESQGVTMSDADLALTVPAAQTTCDTITNSTDAAKAYQASVLIAQTKFQNEETAGWFVDQSIYAFCPSMSPLAQAPQAW